MVIATNSCRMDGMWFRRRPPRRRSSAIVLTAVAVFLGSPIAGRFPLNAEEPPQRSVFEIGVWENAQGIWQDVYGGTAFFISADGRALTASHVVYRVRTGRRYKLLAVVGKEFYSASLICASELPNDPSKSEGIVRTARDIAEIRVTPPDFPFDQITYKNIPYARAHRGPLPAFPALSLGPDPRVGDRVRVLGFGAANQPLPYEWSAEGEVSRKTEFTDGTPGFKIFFETRPAAHGHSGSPVLNLTDQVVGVLDWLDSQDDHIGTAISSLALDPACP